MDPAWVEIAGPYHQRVQVQPGGIVLWEHDCLPGYWRPRHQVGPADGETWEVVQADPLTLSPSLHCAAEHGGCGLHGHIRAGRWE